MTGRPNNGPRPSTAEAAAAGPGRTARRRYVKPGIEEEGIFSFYSMTCMRPGPSGCDEPASRVAPPKNKNC